jgi:hypothetical protein
MSVSGYPWVLAKKSLIETDSNNLDFTFTVEGSMAEKTIGYVELEWTCPNCSTKNPGTQKTCIACGSPQPAKIDFEQAPGQELITDQKLIEQAEKGPDIHCPYCGARNPADATLCGQCGGDLKGGEQRVSGRVIGAFSPQTGPARQIPCPNCATLNPETQTNCSNCGTILSGPPRPSQPTQAVPKATVPSRNWVQIALFSGAGIIVLCVVVFFALSLTRKENLSGQVQSVRWERSIAIEEKRDVTYQTWREEVSQTAVLGTCEKKYHHSQEAPAPVSTEVCGTPYTKDTGSGLGKVVQDCEYRVYQDYCSYMVKEWQVVNQAKLKGQDLSPMWPELNLSTGQRTGQQNETYTVVFDTAKGVYSYNTSNQQLFYQCKPGSEWALVINVLNQVKSIEPK